MTATDRLRELLDERGVEWTEVDNHTLWWGESVHHQASAYSSILFGESERVHLSAMVTPEQAIAATLGSVITGDTSDGYHTFNELYHHRAELFSVIVRDHSELAWKSKLHHDGSMYDGMFIVGIETPHGQATYHYDIDPYWDMFECKELDRAPEWDGHTPDESIARIATLGSGTCVNMDRETDAEWFTCSECNTELRVHEPFDAFSIHFCPNCGRKVVDE